MKYRRFSITYTYEVQAYNDPSDEDLRRLAIAYSKDNQWAISGSDYTMPNAERITIHKEVFERDPLAQGE